MDRRHTNKPIEGNLREDEIKLFTQIATQRGMTPHYLLQQILRNWLEQERTRLRSPSPPETFLPQTCAVLFAEESLEDFSARVRLTLINTVRLREGNLSRAARRLKTDRSSLHKTTKGLKAKTRPNHSPTSPDKTTQ